LRTPCKKQEIHYTAHGSDRIADFMRQGPPPIAHRRQSIGADQRILRLLDLVGALEFTNLARSASSARIKCSAMPAVSFFILSDLSL
jgi:hypothetical protein